MIYLHPDGKTAEAFKGGEIEKIINRQIMVLAPALIHSASFIFSIKKVIVNEPYISNYSLSAEKMYNPQYMLPCVLIL